MEVSIKQRILDVKLFDGLAGRHDNNKNKPNSGGFDDMTEGVILVNANLLMVAPSNQASLVTLERVVGMAVGLKNPATTNDVLGGGRWNESPCLVGHKGLKLMLNGTMPF